MKKIREGWHKLGEFSVYVDYDGIVTRATKPSVYLSGQEDPAALWTVCKSGGWDRWYFSSEPPFEAVKSRFYRGTLTIF